jgi:hypothetical protein
MPDPVIIINRPFWARVFTVIWIVEVVAGLGFAAGGIGMLGAHETGVAAVLIVAGLLLAAVGVVMAGLSIQAARLKGPAIEMRPEGLLDRRIAAQIIPWEAISWRIVFNGRAYSLQFDVAQVQRNDLRLYWAQAAMGQFNRMFSYPELTVLTLGTGHTAHQLGNQMDRFCPQKL